MPVFVPDWNGWSKAPNAFPIGTDIACTHGAHMEQGVAGGWLRRPRQEEPNMTADATTARKQTVIVIGEKLDKVRARIATIEEFTHLQGQFVVQAECEMCLRLCREQIGLGSEVDPFRMSFPAHDRAGAEAVADQWNARLTPEQVANKCAVSVRLESEVLAASVDFLTKMLADFADA
jgi:hypothetical protein